MMRDASSGRTSHEALIARSAARRYGVLCCPHGTQRALGLGNRCDGAQCCPLGVRRQSRPDWAGRLLDSPQSNSAMPCPVCAQRRPHRRAPRLDVAPPAPGRLPADGPARFGQQPTVAPEVGRVPLGTESLAHPGKSNRLMLRVLVRHGAPAPCSRSERRCLGSRRQRLLDTRSVGREFVLAYPAAERSPTRKPRATRDGPPEEGTNPAGRPARSGSLGALGNQGPARPLAAATRTTSRQTGPTRGPRAYRTHTSSALPLATPPQPWRNGRWW